METKVKTPTEIQGWKDKVGGSFIHDTLSGINDVNREAENFARVYEEAAAVLYRSMEYSSMEGEIRSRTVSA